jgi:hypothetical protein
MKLVNRAFLFFIGLVIFSSLTQAQVLKAQSTAYSGFTLYSPNNSKYAYLVDMTNKKVKTWTFDKSGGYATYLLSDGSVLRPALSTNSNLGGGGEAGVIQKYNWAGTKTWEYTYSSSTYRTHHDIEPMPNGNILVVAWEVKTATEAAAAGYKSNSQLIPDCILEIQPSGTTGGTIVWQWHAWDHIIQDYNSSKSNYGVVSAHPELLNINMTVNSASGGGWMHCNSIKYNADLDQIVISSHNLNELYVIDHSTTTAEAATHSGGKSGKGGDILYRWGCPSNYGISGTQYFDVVHSACWIADGCPGAGHIMAFNNRASQTTSQIVELNQPTNEYTYSYTSGSSYAPTAPYWSYTASGFYAVHLGGCQRFPNGNTLITQSLDGKIFEVDSTGNVVWTYTPGGEIVKAFRYIPSYYSGLAVLAIDAQTSSAVPTKMMLAQNYPNPFNPTTMISYEVSTPGLVSLKIYDVLGKEVASLVNEIKEPGMYQAQFNGAGMESGVYFYKLSTVSYTDIKKMMLLK